MDPMLVAYAAAATTYGSPRRRLSTSESELEVIRAGYIANHPVPRRPSILARLKEWFAKIATQLRPELTAGRVAE